MIPSKTPRFISRYFGNYIWEIPNEKNEVFLTFDDGPIPEVTPWILSVLDKFQIKATFFSVGENIKKHPNILQRVIDSGHQVGNHTYNHLSGWKSDTASYLDNIAKTDDELKKFGAETNLFRPPYGKLKPAQSKAIRQLDKNIIMWSVLSKDYLPNLDSEQVYDNIMQTMPGGIIVCHDNIKAFKHLKNILPKSIEGLLSKGFVFKTI
jgi:peptidoglycan/xylan/chitin deacetylase (PgdA/CDA1 family)